MTRLENQSKKSWVTRRGFFTNAILDFHRIGPLGRFSLVVAMSVHGWVVPSPCYFFAWVDWCGVSLVRGLVRSVPRPRMEPQKRGGVPNWTLPPPPPFQIKPLGLLVFQQTDDQSSRAAQVS